MFNVLTTKPGPQAQPLLMALAQLPNIHAENLATIDIAQPSSPGPMQTIVNELDAIEWAIFNSANAVTAAVPLWKPEHQPQHIAAIGPATAQALQLQGCHVDIIASPPSSKGLLTNPALAEVHIMQKRIAIFCGENPKRLLFQQLSKRQANVETIYCYRRVRAKPSSTDLDKIITSPIQAIVCASLESMVNLFQIFAPKHMKWLLSKQLVVINPSMQTLAVQMGCLKSRVHVCENATNQAILTTLKSLSATSV